MKSILSFLLSLSIIVPGFGQRTLRVVHGCSYANETKSANHVLIDPPAEAEAMVRDILQQVAISQSPFVLSAASNLDNAQATMVDNTRYILFNQTFLHQMRTDAKTKWAVISVFAHEIAHHILLHRFDEADNRKRKINELKADEWAGRILARMGATRDEALSGLRTYALVNETETHPNKSAREQAMGISFDEEPKPVVALSLNPKAFNRWNLADTENTTAEADNNKVTLIIKLPARHASRSFQVCLKSNDPSILPGRNGPGSLNGTGNGLLYRNPMRIEWDYRRDGFTKAQVSKDGLLEFYVYETGDLPKRSSAGARIGWGAGIAAGLAGVVWGAGKMKKGKDLHQLYKENPNPETIVWSEEYRQDRYDRANRQWKTGQVLLGAGAVAAAGSAWILLKTLKKDREAATAICFQEKRLLWEPLLAGPERVGVMLRF